MASPDSLKSVHWGHEGARSTPYKSKVSLVPGVKTSVGSRGGLGSVCVIASPYFITGSPSHGPATKKPIFAVYDSHHKKPQIPRVPLFPHILNLRKLCTSAILFSILPFSFQTPSPVLQESTECKVCILNVFSEPQLSEAWFPYVKGSSWPLVPCNPGPGVQVGLFLYPHYSSKPTFSPQNSPHL